jgi:hypothetical protein
MPMVQRESPAHLRMVYTSLLPWTCHGGRWESAYALKSAESHDGLNWQPGRWLFGEAPEGGRAAVRSTLAQVAGRRLLLYCERSVLGFREAGDGAYSLRCAALQGEDFVSLGEVALLPRPEWAREMCAYPWCFEAADGQTWVLFNGNSFGRDGFGLGQLRVRFAPEMDKP